MQERVLQFWKREMTPEKCIVYIDHIYKVVPVFVLMKGSVLFSERSQGKSIAHFQKLLTSDDTNRERAKNLFQF